MIGLPVARFLTGLICIVATDMINQSGYLAIISILPWLRIGELIPFPATVGGFFGGAGIDRDGDCVMGVCDTLGVPTEEWSFELPIESKLSSVDFEIETCPLSDREAVSSSKAA